MLSTIQTRMARVFRCYLAPLSFALAERCPYSRISQSRSNNTVTAKADFDRLARVSCFLFTTVFYFFSLFFGRCCSFAALSLTSRSFANDSPVDGGDVVDDRIGKRASRQRLPARKDNDKFFNGARFGRWKSRQRQISRTVRTG